MPHPSLAEFIPGVCGVAWPSVTKSMRQRASTIYRELKGVEYAISVARCGEWAIVCGFNDDCASTF
jgi:hypothetical protein